MEKIVTEKTPTELSEMLDELIERFKSGEVTREEVLLKINDEIEEMLDSIKPISEIEN